MDFSPHDMTVGQAFQPGPSRLIRERARQAQRELAEIGVPRVNMLLVGAAPVIDALLDALRPCHREPVTLWRPGHSLVLPARHAGTLILRDVGELPPPDQRALFDRLSDLGNQAQVVSTTHGSLLPLLENGAFLTALYYRLNLLLIDASA